MPKEQIQSKIEHLRENAMLVGWSAFRAEITAIFLEIVDGQEHYWFVVRSLLKGNSDECYEISERLMYTHIENGADFELSTQFWEYDSEKAARMEKEIEDNPPVKFMSRARHDMNKG